MEILEEFRRKRGACLSAGILLNFLGGVAYAWSVFVLPLQDRNGWSMSELSLAYTLMSITMLFANMFLVPLARRTMPLRRIILIGGLLYGGGVAICGYASGIFLFYLAYSVIAGIGNALIYPILISYSQELYPERSGFASGLMTAGFGFGSVVWATVANALFIRTGDISSALMILGVIFLVGITVASFFVREIPAGFAEYIRKVAGSAHGKKKGKVADSGQMCVYEKPRGEMLKDPLFYLLYLCVISGVVSGTMLITQGSPIVQRQLSMTAQSAALIVSFLSLANTVGRPVWGMVSDRIGRISSFGLIHLLMGFSMFVLFFCQLPWAFVLALMAAMFCYGGIASLVAPITSDLFGARYITENYGITFTVYGVSSLIGPPVIAMVVERTESYHQAFVFGLMLSIFGLALAVLIAARVRQIRARSQSAVQPCGEMQEKQVQG